MLSQPEILQRGLAFAKKIPDLDAAVVARLKHFFVFVSPINLLCTSGKEVDTG